MHEHSEEQENLYFAGFEQTVQGTEAAHFLYWLTWQGLEASHFREIVSPLGGTIHTH